MADRDLVSLLNIKGKGVKSALGSLYGFIVYNLMLGWLV